MPNPKDFKDQNSWMNACMHQVKKVEGKGQDQAVAQCLAMWRGKGKKKKKKTNGKTRKCAADIIRQIASELLANA